MDYRRDAVRLALQKRPNSRRLTAAIDGILQI